MNYYQSTMQSEQKYRDTTHCPACNKTKSSGMLCCWNCFKYINNPYKFSKTDFESWLKEVRGGEL